MIRALSMFLIACGAPDDPTQEDPPVADGDADTDTDADSDADTDADPEPPCVAVITSVDAVVAPTSGPTPGTFDIDVTASFDASIAETHVYAIEVDGATGTTTLASDRRSMLWEGIVEDGLTFDVTATVCEDQATTSFETPDVGIQGSTFAVLWDDLVVIEPGSSAVLSSFIDGPQFLLAQALVLDDLTGLGTARVTASNSVDALGNPVPSCNLDSPADADFSRDPVLEIRSAELTIPIDSAGGTAVVEGFVFAGRVSADESRLEDVRIEGLIATEQVAPGSDCNSALVALLQPTCLPCVTSATGFCMLYQATVAEALVVETDIAGDCP